MFLESDKDIFMVSLEKNCHEFQAPTNHWLIRQWVFLKNGAHLAGPRFAIIYIYVYIYINIMFHKQMDGMGLVKFLSNHGLTWLILITHSKWS